MTKENQKIVFLISQLIQHRNNDLLIGIKNGEVNNETEQHYTNLILELTRYLHDIRYCSNPDCKCSPESGIKHHYEPIKDYLQRTKYALYHIPWRTIEEIIK